MSILPSKLARKINIADLRTEEATKISLIQPTLKSLGYLTASSNITTVIPEFRTISGEFIDYMIKSQDQVAIIIEAKKSSVKLNNNNLQQLAKYFLDTKAIIGILTNGLEYRVYTKAFPNDRMLCSPIQIFNILNNDLENKRNLSWMTNPLDMISLEKYAKEQHARLMTQIELAKNSSKIIDMVVGNLDREMVKNVVNSSIDLEWAKIAEIKQKFCPKCEASFRTDNDIKFCPNDGTEVIYQYLDPMIGGDEEIITTQLELDFFNKIKEQFPQEISNKIKYRDHKQYFNVLFSSKLLCKIWAVEGGVSQMEIGTEIYDIRSLEEIEWLKSEFDKVLEQL